MQVTCPCCLERFPVEAGFIDGEGKQLAAMFAAMEPALGRSVVAYLRLFKPARTGLRTARAIRLVEDLLDLVGPGTVCRDERSGLRRPASAAVWAAGIEQLLATSGKLALPLQNHHYLRAVVFGLAEQADAAAERTKEAALRAGIRASTPSTRETPLQPQLKWLENQLRTGATDQATYDDQVQAARITLGGAS